MKFFGRLKAVFSRPAESYEESGTILAKLQIGDVTWKQDCGSKEDFDSPLISLSCRYYPDHTVYATLVMFWEGFEHADYVELARIEFKGTSRADAQRCAEDWATQQTTRLYVAALQTFAPADLPRVMAKHKARAYALS